jgi:hypothetical protein
MERYLANGAGMSEAERFRLMEVIGAHGGWQRDRKCRLHDDPRCYERVRAWARLAEVGMVEPIDWDPTAAVVRRAE